MNYETIGTTVLQNEIEPRLDFIENNDQNIVIDTLKDFDLLHVASFEASGSDVDTRGARGARRSWHWFGRKLAPPLPTPLEPWAPVGTVG
jgi:hypothetical protein